MATTGDGVVTIDREKLRFLYQPVLKRETRTVVFVEATLYASQDEFAAYGQAADGLLTSGSIQAQTELIINQLLADLPRLKRIYGDSCAVSFLFPEVVFAEPSTAEIVERALTKHGAGPADLHLGLPQSNQEFSPAVLMTLERLRAVGTLILLGRFGSGPLSFASLGAVKFDLLRVDRHLVQRMMAHKTTHSLIAAIAAFCKDASIVLVADGVDDAMILNELEPFEYQFVQGSLFGDPVEIDALSPPVQPAVSLRAFEASDRTDAAPELAETLRARIDDLDPRHFKSSFSEFLAHADDLKRELRRLPLATEQELACVLGQRVTLAAVYAGEKIAPLDWGLETANLAEKLGHFGVSAQMLALISTVPATTESSRFVRVEALSRALQIRSTAELKPEASGILDNTLAMAFAHMGLFDRCIVWWSNLIRQHEDLDLPGHTYACINLAELEISALEDPGFDGSDVSRDASMRRIDRAVDRAVRSQYMMPGVAEALQARRALLHGEVSKAHALFGTWQTDKPAQGVPNFLVLRARAMLARSNGNAQAYLKHTTQLVDEVADTVILRIHRSQMMIVHIEALTLAGQLDDALLAQRALRDYEVALGQSWASSMFDWMQIRVDVDLQFAHYADLARLPQAVNLDG